MVYYVTRRETFDNLSSWLQDCRANANHNMVIMLVGNKSDVSNRRAVSTEEGEMFARENGLLFIETSAKSAFGVDDAFVATAGAVLAKIDTGVLDVKNESSGVKLGYDPGRKGTSDVARLDVRRAEPGASSCC